MAAYDYEACRQAIASVLEQVDALKRVDLYEPRGKAITDLPAAGIFLKQVERFTIEQAQRFLGRNDHRCEWTIEILLPLTTMSEVQQQFETLASQLREAFDANELLDNSGIVSDAALHNIELVLYRAQSAPKAAIIASLATLGDVAA